MVVGNSYDRKILSCNFCAALVSAFISAVYGLTGSGPFSYLFVRFIIVAVILP